MERRLRSAFANALSNIWNAEKVGKSKCLVKPSSKVIKSVLGILHEHNYIKGYKEISKNLSGPEQKQKVVDLLRKFLISDYAGDLKPIQLERLEKVIYNRFYGVSNMGELNQFLDWPLSEGGVGLNIRTSEHLAQKLETILAQLYSK